MSADNNTSELSEGDLLRAMLALQIADRDARLASAEPPRSEVVLAETGLALGEIAALTGRPYEAVKATVRRAREAKAKKTDGKGKAKSDG